MLVICRRGYETANTRHGWLCFLKELIPIELERFAQNGFIFCCWLHDRETTDLNTLPRHVTFEAAHTFADLVTELRKDWNVVMGDAQISMTSRCSGWIPAFGIRTLFV